MRTPDSDRLLERLEERALESAAEEILVPELDLREALGLVGDGALPDLTLGGYIAEHDRPPAFEGADGQPYTVAIDVEESGEEARPMVAFLLFIRWAATGAGIMEHVESGNVAYGATEDEARQGALALSLYEVKAELDAAIARRRAALEDYDDSSRYDPLPE